MIDLLRKFSPIFFIAVASAQPLLAADNWPDFRGPTFDGHSDATELPLRWSESENIRWKTEIPGRGWSTPVIWRDQIWLTTATPDGKELSALCVNKDSGKIEHQIKLFDVEKPEPVNALNSYASPSPVIEEGRVFVHFGTYGTAAIETATGNVLWQRTDLKLDHKEGPGSSPVLFANFVILTCDGTDTQYLIALDRSTGETKWKTARSVKFGFYPGDFRKAYATPLIAQVDGQPQLISPGAQSAYGYDPETGKELWRIGYAGFSNISRPVVGHGLMYLNTGYMKPQMVAYKLGGSGKIAESEMIWKQASGAPNRPSPLLVDYELYLVSDNGGMVTCLDAKTGSSVWSKRLGGSYSASPIFAAGRIYICDQDGKTFVVKPGPKYEELAVNKLDDGCMASPAVSGRSLYLRTRTSLYRIEE